MFQSRNRRLLGRNAFGLAGLAQSDGQVQSVFDVGLEIGHALFAPSGVGRLTGLETAVQRRLAITDLIATLLILTHDDVGSLVFEDRGSTAASGVIENGMPVATFTAVFPVRRCQRRIATST